MTYFIQHISYNKFHTTNIIHRELSSRFNRNITPSFKAITFGMIANLGNLSLAFCLVMSHLIVQCALILDPLFSKLYSTNRPTNNKQLGQFVCIIFIFTEIHHPSGTAYLKGVFKAIFVHNILYYT